MQRNYRLERKVLGLLRLAWVLVVGAALLGLLFAIVGLVIWIATPEKEILYLLWVLPLGVGCYLIYWWHEPVYETLERWGNELYQAEWLEKRNAREERPQVLGERWK